MRWHKQSPGSKPAWASFEGVSVSSNWTTYRPDSKLIGLDRRLFLDGRVAVGVGLDALGLLATDRGVGVDVGGRRSLMNLRRPLDDTLLGGVRREVDSMTVAGVDLLLHREL